MVEKSNLGLSDPGEFQNSNHHYHGGEIPYPDQHIRRVSALPSGNILPGTRKKLVLYHKLFCQHCGLKDILFYHVCQFIQVSDKYYHFHVISLTT